MPSWVYQDKKAIAKNNTTISAMKAIPWKHPAFIRSCSLIPLYGSYPVMRHTAFGSV